MDYNSLFAHPRWRSQPLAEFFNTSAFAPVPANTPYGNSPRDPILGPAFVNTDLSAFKRFAINEGSDLLFVASSSTPSITSTSARRTTI